ncbi:probable F-actin-capping protein subunit beta [Tanacetum coccineum]
MATPPLKRAVWLCVAVGSNPLAIDSFVNHPSCVWGLVLCVDRAVSMSYVTRIVGKNSFCVNTTEMQTVTVSPWSNKFHPHLEDGMYPSEELRKLEVEAMMMKGHFHTVYLWEEDDNEGFVACFLIKKDGSKYAHGKRGFLHEGGWEAIHVIQMKADLSVEDGHLCNMGKMIEELEGKLRNQLDQVYFGKTKEMVCTLRPPSELLSMTLPDSRDP